MTKRSTLPRIRLIEGPREFIQRHLLDSFVGELYYYHYSCLVKSCLISCKRGNLLIDNTTNSSGVDRSGMSAFNNGVITLHGETTLNDLSFEYEWQLKIIQKYCV